MGLFGGLGDMLGGIGDGGSSIGSGLLGSFFGGGGEGMGDMGGMGMLKDFSSASPTSTSNLAGGLPDVSSSIRQTSQGYPLAPGFERPSMMNSQALSAMPSTSLPGALNPESSGPGPGIVAPPPANLQAPAPPLPSVPALPQIAPSAPTMAPPSVTPPMSTTPPTGQLGSISSKYESGSGGPGTISTGKGDPGGASYGTYQLASRTGTLQSFLKTSGYQSQFKGMQPGTAPFNAQWKDLAGSDPKFGDAQHSFIEKNNFAPVRSYADKLGIPATPGVNEALWSMGVQHGKATSIVSKAGIQSGMPEPQIINKLYDARSDYVRGLDSLSPGMKQNVLDRYDQERQDVLGLSGV